MRTSKDQFSLKHPLILQHQMLDIFQTNEVPSVLKGAFPIRHKITTMVFGQKSVLVSCSGF